MNIPTAKEFLRAYKTKMGLRSQSSPLGSEATEIDALIEFATIHCKHQAKEIIDNVEVDCDSSDIFQGVNEESILNAYPLTNIK